MSYSSGTCHISQKNQEHKYQRCLIGFENLKISCVIGVYPEERNSFQEIFVDLKVALNNSSTMICSDCLENTVDYTVLADQCIAIAKKNTYHLLETYASNVLDDILSLQEICWAWIRVKKPKGLMAADFTFVELSKGVNNQ